MVKAVLLSTAGRQGTVAVTTVIHLLKVLAVKAVLPLHVYVETVSMDAARMELRQPWVHTIAVAQDTKTSIKDLVTGISNLAVHRPDTDVVLILCPQLLGRTLRDALDRSKPLRAIRRRTAAVRTVLIPLSVPT